MSAQSDSEASSFSSQVSCGQQTPLVAVLTSFESSLQIESGSAANTTLSSNVPAHAVTLNIITFSIFRCKNSRLNKLFLLENLSVLRV